MAAWRSSVGFTSGHTGPEVVEVVEVVEPCEVVEPGAGHAPRVSPGSRCFCFFFFVTERVCPLRQIVALFFFFFALASAGSPAAPPSRLAPASPARSARRPRFRFRRSASSSYVVSTMTSPTHKESTTGRRCAGCIVGARLRAVHTLSSVFLVLSIPEAGTPFPCALLPCRVDPPMTPARRAEGQRGLFACQELRGTRER